MKGSEARLLGFMEGANNRYVIPVYQRKYDWKIENCEKLYDDLKKVIRNKRGNHFFGSITSQVVPNGSIIEFHIIDGQQRITTVTLLLLAISNLVKEGRIHSDEEGLNEQILQRFIIAPWAKKDDKIKLRPVRRDRLALEKLFGSVEDYERESNLTINYQYFYDRLLKEEVSVDDLYAAIGKLEIISITLDHDDDPQLIFESLNSTGLALNEGDKIRNYILMGLSPKNQELYYDNYWVKIEQCTANDVSGFIRDYLSVKCLVTPTINNVYLFFKRYAEEAALPIENLLSDILRYARFYNKLITCKSGLDSIKLDDCLYRLKRLEIVVTRPFFMEVLRLNQDKKLSTDDVLQVFEITENYLFRRNICEVPTNALNKIFLNLNKEICRYDNTSNNYINKLIYALLSKKESGRFPNDEEFTTALENKSVYQMRGKYKAYLFERLENFGTIEAKDVYTHLDNNIYTIEHIMPQHLTPAWVESLGPNAEEIHSSWLHRLANLTLTGYNPSLSNNTFLEKRDAEIGGYKASGLRMNVRIAMKDSWGLPELQERNAELLSYAKKIWAYPSTTFIPDEKEFDSCTLDDENVDLTGRDIVKYSFQNIEQPVTSWADMLEHVVVFLHSKDKSVLSVLAYSTSASTDLSNYVSNKAENLRSGLKIDENIYIERNTSTALKISILRRLFVLYGVDPMDLVFFLRDKENAKAADEGRYELRKCYWAYALPMIQEAHSHRGSFSNATPVTSNWVAGSFGIGGFTINCVANYDEARVDFWLGSSDITKNKKAFDLLFVHKDDIERKLGISDLLWNRADSNKASWIYYCLKGVSITNESDWPRMAKFHASWSSKIADVMIPYLAEMNADLVIDPERAEKNKALFQTSILIKKWASSRSESKEISINTIKSNRTYTRFRTQFMDDLLPDTSGTKSGWNTENHYFYEIVNRTGKSAYIQLAFSSKDIPEDQLKTIDLINDFYPSKNNKDDWQWRTPFKTSVVQIDLEDSEDRLFEKLDKCLEEIRVFEYDLKKKLSKTSDNSEGIENRQMNSICIRKVSITDLSTDVVVNAANDGLWAGTGVCGAIFRAAGRDKLQAACDAIGHCDTGSAVITPGFNLEAKYIIHAVGPVWSGGNHNEPQLLYSAYRSALELAVDNGCHSIGFPLLSAGVFGYPKDKAWETAIQACSDFFQKNPDADLQVIFAVLDDRILSIGQNTLNDIAEEYKKR